MSVDPHFWSVMYQPMFDKLLVTGSLFKGKEYALYRMACKELPRLIRYSKKSVSRDISEQPLKIYLTVLAYVSLLIISAFRRYEVVSINEKQQRFPVYPWHQLPDNEETLRIDKRKVTTVSAPFSGEVIHWLVANAAIWRWLYKEPSWLEKLYREVLSGGESSLLLGQGVVYFDNPFQSVQAETVADFEESPRNNVDSEVDQDEDETPFADEPIPEDDSLLNRASDEDLDLEQLIAEETRADQPGKETESAAEEKGESLDVAHEFNRFMSKRNN